jgi:hypothetical protein
MIHAPTHAVRLRGSPDCTGNGACDHLAARSHSFDFDPESQALHRFVVHAPRRCESRSTSVLRNIGARRAPRAKTGTDRSGVAKVSGFLADRVVSRASKRCWICRGHEPSLASRHATHGSTSRPRASYHRARCGRASIPPRCPRSHRFPGVWFLHTESSAARLALCIHARWGLIMRVDAAGRDTLPREAARGPSGHHSESPPRGRPLLRRGRSPMEPRQQSTQAS